MPHYSRRTRGVWQSVELQLKGDFMRNLGKAVALCGALILAGCGTTAENYQRGDNSERAGDIDSCMVEATREVPQRLDYAGIDLNHEIRMRYFNECMAEKGYTRL